MIDHVRSVSQAMIFTLGTILSLDEMMIRFFGRSLETQRMKNKPIREGCKLFVLATKNGYVVNFTPEGRSAPVRGEQEYENDKSKGKIESMIMYVLSVISDLKDVQQNRMKDNRRRTRNNGEFNEIVIEKYCLAMDNYFTLPKIIAKLRDMDVGVVGTARFKRNWPQKEIREVTMEKSNFNNFFWSVDEHGTLIARWVDNGLVFCVTTLHKINNTVKKLRNRPRKTINNIRHVDKI